MKKADLDLIFFVEVLWFIVLLASLFGWALNIVKLVQTGFTISQWGWLEVARVIGIPFAPLGAVMGWL